MFLSHVRRNRSVAFVSRRSNAENVYSCFQRKCPAGCATRIARTPHPWMLRSSLRTHCWARNITGTPHSSKDVTQFAPSQCGAIRMPAAWQTAGLRCVRIAEPAVQLSNRTRMNLSR